jgi:hypothetical protein
MVSDNFRFKKNSYFTGVCFYMYFFLILNKAKNFDNAKSLFFCPVILPPQLPVLQLKLLYVTGSLSYHFESRIVFRNVN